MGIFSRRKKAEAGQPLPPPDLTTAVASSLASVSAPASEPGRPSSVVRARRTGYASVDIVGESFHTKAISKVVKGKAGEHWKTATLVRDPKNRYDANAVRVDIGGRTVGHIAREEAVAYHSLLAAAERVGCTVEVDCRVWFSTDYGEPRASVRLDMVEPQFAWPVNPVANTDSVGIWPEGRRLKVSPGPEHSAATSRLLTSAYEAGGCCAYVELAAPAEGTKLVARFDGADLGSLSPAASKKMRPVVEAANRGGRTVLALVEAKGNSLAVDIKLLVAPPEDLSEDEIRVLTG